MNQKKKKGRISRHIVGKTLHESLNDSAMGEIEELWPRFFKDRHRFNKWLKTKNPALGDKTPQQIINSGRPGAIATILHIASQGIPS